jgi:hypothetical protein
MLVASAAPWKAPLTRSYYGHFAQIFGRLWLLHRQTARATIVSNRDTAGKLNLQRAGTDSA